MRQVILDKYNLINIVWEKFEKLIFSNWNEIFAYLMIILRLFNLAFPEYISKMSSTQADQQTSKAGTNETEKKEEQMEVEDVSPNYQYSGFK